MKNILLILPMILIAPYFSQTSMAQQGEIPGQEAAVAALQATAPQNMDEFMENGILYLKYWRYDLAKECFGKVSNYKPKEADWLRLHEMATRLSAGYLDELSEAAELQPEGASLADAIRDAIDKKFNSEEAIADAVKAFLAAGWGSEESAAAFAILSKTGDNSAAALLGELYKEETTAENRKKIGTALLKLDSSAHEPLIAALDAPEPNFVMWCIAILGRRTDADTSPFLYGFTASEAKGVRQAAQEALKNRQAPVYSQGEAAVALAQNARFALDGKAAIANSSEGFVELWSWNEEKNMPVCTKQPHRMAQLLRAVRLARGAQSLAPRSRAVELIYWTCEAEFLAAYPDIAREMFASISLDSMTSDSVEKNIAQANALLEFALQYGYSAAAASACKILGDIKSEAALASDSGNFSALARALANGNPKVRWAACEAIMAINPRAPYLGSSQLPKTLAWFILGEGRKKVLIVSPKSADSYTVGGFLPEGYEPVVATTGKQALQILQYEPEIFAVFYSMESYSVPPQIFLEKIRAIPVASEIPVAVMARVRDFQAAKLTVSNHVLTMWVPRPTSVLDMDRALKSLEQMRVYSMPTEKQTINFAAQASKYGAALAQLCYGSELTATVTPTNNQTEQKSADANSSEKKPADAAPAVVLASRHNPVERSKQEIFCQMYDLKSLADAAQYQLGQNLAVDENLLLLQNIPTHNAQSQIINYASNTIFSAEKRMAAVKALEKSITQYGILLTTDQIDRQYDLYNAEMALAESAAENAALPLDSEDEESKEEKPTAQLADTDTLKILDSLLNVLETPWNQAQAAQKKAFEQAAKKDYPESRTSAYTSVQAQ